MSCGKCVISPSAPARNGATIIAPHVGNRFHAPSGLPKPGGRQNTGSDRPNSREGPIRIMHYENHKTAIEDLEARILTIRDSL